MRKLLDDEQGQAVVEYVLMLMTAMSVVTIIGIGFRKSLFKIWTIFSQDIAAACPGCPPDPRYKLK